MIVREPEDVGLPNAMLEKLATSTRSSGTAIQGPGLDGGAQGLDPRKIGDHEADQRGRDPLDLRSPGRGRDERANYFQGFILGRDCLRREQAIVSLAVDYGFIFSTTAISRENTHL